MGVVFYQGFHAIATVAAAILFTAAVASTTTTSATAAAAAADAPATITTTNNNITTVSNTLLWLPMKRIILNAIKTTKKRLCSLTISEALATGIRTGRSTRSATSAPCSDPDT